MSYLNADEIESAISNLSSNYQNLCRLIRLQNTTIEGRTCHALYIGKQLDSNNNTVFVTGGVHAREWGSPDICVYFAADMLEAYADNTGLRYGGKYFNADEIRSIVEGLNILIFPCVNPDGRHYSQTSDPMWRRNRNPSESAGNPDCVGVDLNRNFNFLWDFTRFFSPLAVVRTSADPCDDVTQTYRGSAPFSEPETMNVKWLLDNYPMIKWYIDIHSYGEDILHCWGDDENQSGDPSMNFSNPLYNSKRGLKGDDGYREYMPNTDLNNAVVLANSIHDGIEGVRGKKYTVGPGFDLYATSGASDDYATSRKFFQSDSKILGFTIEWGERRETDETSFHPPWAEMEKIVSDISAGILQFCLTATSQTS